MLWPLIELIVAFFAAVFVFAAAAEWRLTRGHALPRERPGLGRAQKERERVRRWR